MTFPSSQQVHAEWKTDGKSFVLFNLSFLESLNHRVPAYCSAKGVGTSPLSASHRSLGMNLAPGAPRPAHRSYHGPAMNTGTNAILLPQSPSMLQASNQIQQKTPQPGMVDFFRKCAPPPPLGVTLYPVYHNTYRVVTLGLALLFGPCGLDHMGRAD